MLLTVAVRVQPVSSGMLCTPLGQFLREETPVFIVNEWEGHQS